MNVWSIVLWGFAATIALTTLMAACHGVGLTRMSIPFLLGTIPDAVRLLRQLRSGQTAFVLVSRQGTQVFVTMRTE